MNKHWMKLGVMLCALFLAAPATALASDGEADEEAKETRVDAQGRVVMEGERIRVTGSRIARDADVYGPGRSLHTSTPVTVYDRNDLHSTGQPFVRDALRNLDPRIH